LHAVIPRMPDGKMQTSGVLASPDTPQVYQNETLEEYVPKHAAAFFRIGTFFSSNSAAKQWQSVFVSFVNQLNNAQIDRKNVKP